ncbi:MAG TPA: hypothetical protein VNX69_16655, partial [Steroidobacteraceae bacterium]|nr:hypothetical protein [Steroidobacteraceae bacterium]
MAHNGNLQSESAALQAPQIERNDLPAAAAGELRANERQAAIEKAKREWECTADALSAMVCLLNSEGMVLRANRVVEHWGLGSVSGVVGKKA